MFCCKFTLLRYCIISYRSVNNTQRYRKNKKGVRFLNSVYLKQYALAVHIA